MTADGFLKALDAGLTRAGVGRGARLLSAVSGGADSVALLTGLVRLAGARGLELVVAHLDHRMRGDDSRADAEFVENLAHQLDLPFVLESADVPTLARQWKLTLEAAARRVRYDFLHRTAADHHCPFVVTAHTADDNAETVLMNISRGASCAGIAGIPVSRPIAPGSSVTLARPMLEVRRSEVERFLRSLGRTWRTDLTNFDTSFTRNRVRLELIPGLQQGSPVDVVDELNRLARMGTGLLRELDRAGAQVLPRLRRDDGPWMGLATAGLVELPAPLGGHLVRQALSVVAGGVTSFERVHVGQVLDLARAGRTGTSLTLPGDVRVYRDYDRLLFSRGSMDWPGFGPVALPAPGSCRVETLGLTVSASIEPVGGERVSDFVSGDRLMEVVDADRVAVLGPLSLRTRRAGDRFRPLGSPGRRKLQDFLTDRRVPRFRRAGWPILTAGESIVWALGLGIEDELRVGPGTERLLTLKVCPPTPVFLSEVSPAFARKPRPSGRTLTT